MLATFRVPEGEPTFVSDLVERWRQVHQFEPPYNYLFKMTPVRPGLLPDERIDLDYHLRHSALPQPGSQREASASSSPGCTRRRWTVATPCGSAM